MENKTIVNPSPKGYVVTHNEHTYWAGHVQPTKGYPKTADNPFKMDVCLMESKPDDTGINQMTFTRLKKWDAHDRSIISDITKAVCNYINQPKKKD